MGTTTALELAAAQPRSMLLCPRGAAAVRGANLAEHLQDGLAAAGVVRLRAG